MESNNETEFALEEAFSNFLKHRTSCKEAVEKKQEVQQSPCADIDNQPSTSGLSSKNMVQCKRKRKINVSASPKIRVKEKPIKINGSSYSPPVTRNYSKLSNRELHSLAQRIQIFHEEGKVVPENMADIVPCKNKRKQRKCTDKVIGGERIPGTHFGKGRVGVSCSNYGVSKCLCCNTTEPQLPAIEEKEVKEAFESGGFCSTFGIKNCICCPKNDTLNLTEEADVVAVDHLSVSQIQSVDNIDIDSDEVVNSGDSNITVKPPTLALSKHKFMEKFLDSFTHDRVDYSKPEQQDIVESVIHSPVTYYSENLSEDVNAPEKTILKRVDFQKEQERLARLSLLYNTTSISSQHSETYSNFTHLGICASSTPTVTIPTKVNLSPIEGDISDKSPERPIESVEPQNICDSSSVQIMPNIGDENAMERPPLLDFSLIDTSHVTLRTPYKARLSPLENISEGHEDSLMDFVNNLFAEDEDNIVQECQLRCQRIIENRQNTYMAFSNALDAVDLLDDDIGDNSIQIIDNTIELVTDGNSDDSVQFVAEEGRQSPSKSDVQIVDFPSTSSHYRKKRKVGGTMPSDKPVVFNVEDEPPNASASHKARNCIQECSICLEPLRQAKAISSTFCGHIFCTPCIKDAIKSVKKCPMCRKNLTLKKIHPVFLF